MDLKAKLVELLSQYFDIGDSYAYNLTRVKTAFGVGTMSLDDFEEFDDEVVADIADHLIANDVTVQEWISVKDRLPHKNMRVLACYTFDGYMQFVQVLDYYATDKKPHFQHEGDGMCVTHWMPLPEPPKGD